MARKHVFPIVGTNLKVIDNDVINSLGPGEDIVAGARNVNEDKNVEWYINPSSQEGVGFVYFDKKDHEVLLDFDETPSDVYSEILSPDPDAERKLQIYHGPGRTSGVSGGIDVDAKLVPGSVFCVGVKNKASDQTILNYLLYFTSPEATDLEFPFHSGSGVVPPTSNAEMGVGSWVTYMFDGKRLVFLGSNNWV